MASLKFTLRDPEEREGFVCREVGVTVREMRKESREVDFIASTDCIDSYDEIVDQSSWDLKRFKTNPVILFGHKSRELPIGRATRCEVINGALECTIKFASAEANPLAEQVMKLVEEKCLNAVSVGFYPRTIRWEKRNDKDVYVLSDNELHEISIVSIPANPEALAKMKDKAKAGAERTAKGKDMLTEAEVKALQSTLAEREATIAAFPATEKALTDERAKTAALELQVKTIGEERDALKAEKSILDGKVIDQEVEALVGKKLLPAEKEEFVELATINRPLFEKMIAKRGDIGVLGPKIVTPEVDPVGKVDVKADSDDLVELALDAASKDETL